MDMSNLSGLGTLHALAEELAEAVAQKTADGRPTSFGYCLRKWIENYNVIEAVGGDQSTYLLVVLLALAKFHEDPSYFGESAAEAITETFDLGGSLYGVIPPELDPYKWKEWVFRRQCGLPLDM